MKIIVNGKPKELAESLSLQALLETLELGSGRIAVEINGSIVPRSNFDEQLIVDGNRVEIVQAIGGG